MDPDFSGHYQQELHYITASMASGFAARHPKIADRFGILGTGEISDPFIQRLLQNYSAIAARSQIRIERMADPVPQRTLQCVHPNYVTPLPSMAIVQFNPGYKTGQGMDGQRLPRGTELTAPTSEQISTAVVFRTSQDVVIYPLGIAFACVTGIPPDIPALYRFVFGDVQVKGALRLRIRTANGLPIRELQGLDRLPIYLCGEPQLASRLFELIHTSTLASVTGVPGQFASGELHGVFQNGLRKGRMQTAVEYEGLAPEDSLLLPTMPHLHGHNLIHEFFAYEPRYWFFTLTGLAEGLSKIEGPEAEIVLLLSREASELGQQVDAAQFALFCSPAINLFHVRTERLKVDPAHREHRLVPNVDAPDDYVLHSVERLKGR